MKESIKTFIASTGVLAITWLVIIFAMLLSSCATYGELPQCPAYAEIDSCEH